MMQREQFRAAVYDAMFAVIAPYVDVNTDDGDRAARKAATYAAESSESLAGLWGTDDYEEAVEVAARNAALVAGLDAHRLFARKQRDANRQITAALFMAVRIAAAAALA